MNRRLVLLDDSLVSRAILGPAFVRAGWEVLGTEGAGRGPVDVLVVDPSTENYKGMTVLADLFRRNWGKTLPVLALLRDDRPSLRVLLAETGCAHALKGRLSPEKLVDLVEAVWRKGGLGTVDPIRFSAQLGTCLGRALAGPGETGVRTLLYDGLLGAFLGQSDPVETLHRAWEFLTSRFPLESCSYDLVTGSGAEGGTFGGPESGLGPGGSFELDLSGAAGSVLFRHRISDSRVMDLFAYTASEVGGFLEVLIRMDRASREAEKIRVVFSRFLPPEVIEDLLRKRTDTALLTGEKRRVVAFFSHIRDFSYYVDHNDPGRLVGFLNRHFELYSRIIRSHGGSINKYIGDAVFALFGAPVSYPDNARRALDAALEIQWELRNLPPPDLEFPEEGYHAGIGLNEGPAIIGNIGSLDSFDYTAIGDTINLAARLESLNKYYLTDILISDGFRQALGLDVDPSRLRIVDRAKVKGKDMATTVYTVLSDNPEDNEELEFLGYWTKGMKMFKIGNWNMALEYFTRCRERKESDHLAALYCERCLAFLKQPPDSWDGSVSLTFK